MIQQNSMPEIIIVSNIDRAEFWKVYNPYIETLLNNVMQNLGIQVYMEAIDNGFILYCKHYQDFYKLYSCFPVQLQKNIEPSAESVRWRFEFIENRSGISERELVNNIAKFYRKVNTVVETDYTKPHSYIMQFHGIPHFFEAMEDIIHMLQKVNDSDIERQAIQEKKLLKQLSS
jgi:hypothetical protein